MTIKKLQKLLDKQNVKVKILYIKKTNFGDYEIVYTEDVSYVPEIPLGNRGLIWEKEKDILASDYEEAIEFIKNPVKLQEE